MSQLIASGVCALGILGLFAFERNRKVRTSWALWIPTIWVLIASSRFASQWLVTTVHPENTQRQIDGSPFDALILSGLIVVAILALVCRQRRVMTILRMNWPILLFFSYCAVSVLWSDYPDVAFKRWVKTVGDLAMVLVVITDREPSAAIKRLLARVGFLLIPLSVLLIEYYPGIGQAYSLEDGVTVYTGVTMNKNTLGLTCLILGLASLWRLVHLFRNNAHKVRQWAAHGAVLVLTLWLLYMVNSATSLACFLLGSALLVALSLPGARPARVHLIVMGLVSVAVLTLVLPDVYVYIVQALGRNTTLTGRTSLWKALLGMDTNPWFGTGFASFWLGSRLDKLWSVFSWYPNEAHNGYLEIFLNLGWIGLVLLTVLLVTGYRNVVSAFRRDPEVGALRLAYFAVAVAYNFTEAGFRMLDPIWILFLFAIIAVPEAPIRRDPANIDMPAEVDRCSGDLTAVSSHVYEGTT